MQKRLSFFSFSLWLFHNFTFFSLFFGELKSSDRNDRNSRSKKKLHFNSNNYCIINWKKYNNFSTHNPQRRDWLFVGTLRRLREETRNNSSMWKIDFLLGISVRIKKKRNGILFLWVAVMKVDVYRIGWPISMNISTWRPRKTLFNRRSTTHIHWDDRVMIIIGQFR